MEAGAQEDLPDARQKDWTSAAPARALRFVASTGGVGRLLAREVLVDGELVNVGRTASRTDSDHCRPDAVCCEPVEVLP